MKTKIINKCYYKIRNKIMRRLASMKATSIESEITKHRIKYNNKRYRNLKKGCSPWSKRKNKLSKSCHRQ